MHFIGRSDGVFLSKCHGQGQRTKTEKNVPEPLTQTSPPTLRQQENKTFGQFVFEVSYHLTY